jgi:enoyl-CoA hydratase/carnithine racemase
MVNKLCPPGDAVGAALRLAEQICANAPLAVQTSRNLVLRGTRVDDDEAWEMTDAAIVDVMRGEDFAEGPRAFIEKRAPVWTGR